MSIDLCGIAVRIPPHKHRVACSSRRIFNNVRISHGHVVKCTYSPHNWEPQEELHNQNWQPQQDHNWQQQQQHYNQQQQQHYNQQQQQHYNQQQRPYNQKQQRPYNQQQQDHNWQQQQQDYNQQQQQKHYNQQQQQQPYNQQQQLRFYNQQQQQQFSNPQQQQRFYNQQQQQPDSIQSQQQPEPDFNDISGLSDLSDLSSDTDSTRFVPSFSRVARRGFAKRYELFPGGPVDTSPQEGQQDGITPRIPDESMDLPKGPTHKEMIAARRHYLKRQARRGLLPPSRPIRKRFPLDDSF